LLEAHARRSVPDGPPGARGRKRPIRRSSSNSHLHFAVAIAIAVSSLVAIAIPITRTEAGPDSPAYPAAAQTSRDPNFEALRIQAAGVTAALASNDIGPEADASAVIQPPLGAGLFPPSLLTEAARITVRDAFPTPDGQGALAITRATPVSFTVHEDGFTTSYSSTQLTVGQALASHGIQPGEADLVTPPLGSPLSPGAHIYIRHATEVRLVVAGKQQLVKTHMQTVGDVLAQAGVALEGLDRVTPGQSKPVRGGMLIKVTTVRDVIETVEEPIPYASLIQYNAELSKGQQELAHGGWNGWLRKEYRVRLINGRETRRELVSETITPPQDEIVSIGTYVRPSVIPAPAPVVAGAVATPAPAAAPGCARTLNVYATWYTAASAGGSGVTATGTGVYKGIVAVDPGVIPLGTRMYIPGYGYGLAADTGGGVKGNHIDLGYGADDIKDWRSRWVEICIL
jgi:3D (Asp-Asp-Asp) domain-containing protein